MVIALLVEPGWHLQHMHRYMVRAYNLEDRIGRSESLRS